MKFLTKYSSLICIGFALSHAPSLYSETIAIIGGQDDLGTRPYVAYVSSKGRATRITAGEAPTPGGEIFSVGMNRAGQGLIGGRDGGFSSAYAAVVSPNGVLKKISGPDIPVGLGLIERVAINASGTGIIGGYDGGFINPYAAIVSPEGMTTKISGAGIPIGTGGIYSVAINSSGSGMVGGLENGSTDPYAAMISPAGVATRVSGAGAPQPGGIIDSVAINTSGAGIMGGMDNGTTDFYAAIVSPEGIATEVSGVGAPPGSGRITAVAINDKGQGLIGGRSSGFIPYAAVVTPNGTATRISGAGIPVGTGQIRTADINQAGMGIIGGRDNNNAYAALVLPTGETRPIKGAGVPVGTGFILSAAINDSGIGLIGGEDQGPTTPYVAIVAPNGTTTRITGQLPIIPGTIFSVAILDELDPKSFGPGNTFADPLTALSTNILSNHANNVLVQREENLDQVVTADASDRTRWPPDCKNPNYALWASPFGLYARYDKKNSFPTLKDRSVGGIIGFDYLGWNNVVLGGGVAYSYQDIDYSNNHGNAYVHQELLTLYTAWQGNHITIDGALWGGIYQLSNKRKTLGLMTSRSNIDGGLFSPHLGMKFPFKINQSIVTVAPYFMLDWVNNWQGSVNEKGSSGLNLKIDSHYVSLLRSEIGLHLRQTLRLDKGDLTFEESGSYVNRAPFNAKKVQAFYVGSISTFSLQLFNNHVENLGALRLSGRYTPCDLNTPFISLNYLGEFSSHLQLHTLALEIGTPF